MKTSTAWALAMVISVICIGLSAISTAAPREDVLKVLEGVVTADGSTGTPLKVWANDGDNLPLEEGTPIAFHFASEEDLHLTAFYLDADGNLVLLYPAPNGTTLPGQTQLDLEAGDATTPYGQESLFVVGSKEPITRKSLGIDSMDPYAVLEPDVAMNAVQKLRELVQQGAPGTRVDLHIVPQSSTEAGYTRGGIVQYFTEATRSLHRPKLALEINFETGSAGLLDEVRGDLDVVGAALSDDRLAGKRFMLVGHTDHRGETDYNQTLSEERARAARAYLVENYQVDPARLESMGHGESKPMMQGGDANAMRRNRRVELELVR